MKRVLIPSDDRDFVPNFAEGYRSLGLEAIAGHINFQLDLADVDIVHVLWPEEFSSWRVPTESQIDAIAAQLDRWLTRSRLIVSVNNIYPHGNYRNPLFHRLYSEFYRRAEVIHHFSQTSKDMVCNEYPSVAERTHVVKVGFNYERFLRLSVARDRTASRQTFGFDAGDIVFLVIGDLRFWDEICLIQRGFDCAKIERKRLLLAARYVEGGSGWRQRWRRWQWRRWQRSRNVRSRLEWVPDEELCKFFDAADAVVVVRKNSLNSGVPSAAMTFGRFVIAPNYGSAPEYLAGTQNALYDQSSPEDLSRAMEFAAKMNREEVGKSNAQIAADWGWESITRACVEALPRPID